MSYLRRFYESLPWWELEPNQKLVIDNFDNDEKKRVLIKSDNTRWWTVYFPRYLASTYPVQLKELPQGTYSGKWFDPRSGKFIPSKVELTPYSGFLILPTRPDDSDWLLVLEKIK
jgi:hypothetical protein